MKNLPLVLAFFLLGAATVAATAAPPEFPPHVLANTELRQLPRAALGA